MHACIWGCAGKAAHVAECRAQIVGQAIDHLRAPPLSLLSLRDITANLPAKQHQFPTNCLRRTLPCARHARIQVVQPAV
jgi:hypothetical protein